MSTTPPARIDSQLSSCIRLIRVICIFFMMYVHVNPGSAGGMAPSNLAWLKLIFSDTLGRASVPTLTIISGFLIVPELGRKSFGTAIRGRVSKLLAPMFIWNAVLLLTGFAILKVTHSETSAIRDLEGLKPWQVFFHRILVVNADGATPALNFLRDIFACSLFAPLLITGIKRFGLLAVASVWAVGIYGTFEPVVFRTSIPLFYTVGIYLALNNLKPRVTGLWLLAGFVGLAVTLVLELAGAYSSESVMDVVNLGKRLSLSVLLFACTLKLQAWPRTAAFISSIEPRIYFIFLSHSFFFLLCWGVWQVLFGKTLAFPYVLFYALLPVVWILLSKLAYAATLKLPKPLSLVLRGK